MPDRRTDSCSQPPAGAWGCWDTQRLLSYGDGEARSPSLLYIKSIHEDKANSHGREVAGRELAPEALRVRSTPGRRYIARAVSIAPQAAVPRSGSRHAQECPGVGGARW